MSKDLSRYWKTVVDTMQDGLLVVDPEGTVVSMNHKAEDLTGYSKSELLGKPCTVLKCTGCKVFGNRRGHPWCSLYAQRQIRLKRCQITNKAGQIVEVVKQASLLKDESGKLMVPWKHSPMCPSSSAKTMKLTTSAGSSGPKRGFTGFWANRRPWNGCFN